MHALLRRSAPLALVLWPAMTWAATSVDNDQLDLKLAPGDRGAVKADAQVSPKIPQLLATLRVSVEADPNRPGDDPFKQAGAAAASRESVGLDASWAAPSAARVDVSVTDKFDQTWRGVSLGLISDHQVSTDEHGAKVGLSLNPLAAIDLNLTGAAAQKTVLDTAAGDAALSAPRSQLSTTTQSAGAGLKWRLAPWFSVDADGKLETADASWRGALAGAAPTGASLTYAYFEPALTGTLTTPGKGSLGLTFEHAVSPLDSGAFATFAAVENRAADARIGPNREWRYRLHFDQTLADVIKVSAAVTQARIESATELGPVGYDLQAPISVSGGERREADLSVSTPLAALGLPSFTLKGAGAWRDSQVRDPFTGDLRRASGESPQTATVGIVQSLLGGGAQWGLEGRFAGDQTLYQMSQLTTVSVGDSLGGFVEYRPGAFALRLQVDGLYGGARSTTDLYYAGTRAGGSVDRIDHREDDGQAVRLILRKAL